MQIEEQRAQLTEQQRELVALKKTIDIAKSDVVEHPPEAGSAAIPAPAPERPSETRFKMVDAGNRTLEQQIQVAEKETEALQEELRQLDENWSTRLAGLGFPMAARCRHAGCREDGAELMFPPCSDGVMQAATEARVAPPVEMKRSSPGIRQRHLLGSPNTSVAERHRQVKIRHSGRTGFGKLPA